jgi:hypothetical protein
MNIVRGRENLPELLAQEKVKLLVGLIEQHEIVGTSSIISTEIHNHVFGTNEDKFIRSPYFLAFYTSSRGMRRINILVRK